MKKNLLLLFAIALLLQLTACKNVANYPITESSDSCVENRIKGVWKFMEDTNQNNFYEVYQYPGGIKSRYHVRFWNRGGMNPTYESNIFFSRIGKTLFINVPYWESMDEDHSSNNWGYGFLKIMEANEAFDKMTVAVVNDNNMRQFKNSHEVRAHVTKNLDNKDFYQQQLKHFYKMPMPEILAKRGGLGDGRGQ